MAFSSLHHSDNNFSCSLHPHFAAGSMDTEKVTLEDIDFD